LASPKRLLTFPGIGLTKWSLGATARCQKER
jgi:hypothetical protein